MRARRAIALVLLTAFVSGFGVPWLAGDHRFNDDVDGEFIQLSASSDIAVVAEADPGTADHCLACHWLRSLRTASRPAAAAALQPFLLLTPPVVFSPSLRSGAVSAPGARGPPAAV